MEDPQSEVPGLTQCGSTFGILGFGEEPDGIELGLSFLEVETYYLSFLSPMKANVGMCRKLAL